MVKMINSKKSIVNRVLFYNHTVKIINNNFFFFFKLCDY